MLETMYVRCTHCGYDNSPEYRFCGMCGGSLAHPLTETRPPARDVAPPPPAPIPVKVSAPVPTPVSASVPSDGDRVHGPSFLGLSEESRVEFNYLYEDEPARSHAGVIAVLLFLIAAGGGLGWQWRHNGFPFQRMSAASGSGQPAPPSPAPDASRSQEQQTDKTAEKSMTGVGDVPAAAADQKTQTDSSGEAPAIPAQEGQSTGASPNPVATETNPIAKATPPPSVPLKSHGGKQASAHPRPARVEPAVLATSPDSDLELAGERYLYGSGLPKNCVRAESNLRTAATHGNPKAETVLGTMYATGHCVGRDLPTAYRWFARALHEEPQNSRISADLQVLWRQMTPQEKQLATTSGQ
jgi:hypothetical protein